MGPKRKADRSLKPDDTPGHSSKLVKHSGSLASLKDCEALHATLLSSTAQYRVSGQDAHHTEEKVQRPGKTTRAMARAQADQQESTPVDLQPLPIPPVQLSDEEVLKRRLQHVKKLKTFYGRVYMSMLSHMVDLTGAMKRTQHPVLHELDPQMPRVSDTDRDAGTEAHTSKTGASEDGTPTPRDSKSPAKDTVMSPKTSVKPEPVMSPSSLPKADSVSKSPSSSIRKANGKLPCFSEAEEEILRHSTRSKNGSSSGSTALLDRLSKSMAINTAFQMIASNMEGLADLERLASSVAARDMAACEACAVLCGRNTRFYLHQTIVIIGRNSKTRGEVDVDLTLEGPTTKLSRIQCLLELDLEFGYVLRNLGRQSTFVNNMEVSKGMKIKLPHLSLLGVGGIYLLFLYNQAALRRIMLNQAPCPKELTETM